ncbi:hypothetical protein H7F20_00845 [Robiginitalea sp. SC105]|nr:hypothetical protein [Robiginitalea sp. SC105]
MLLAGLLGFSCTQYGQLDYVCRLPGGVNEASGMVTYNGQTIWVIEDGSNPDKIREVDTTGNLLREYEVKDARNKDWEALTTDTLGRLYIGDFGNNLNSRDDLVIYRLPDPRQEPGDKIDAEAIRFSYPDQKHFPPEKNARFFDAEGFFHLDGHLYIITKNRARPFNGMATIYRVPDEPGEYKAELVTRIFICGDRRGCQVTDAALSPSGNRLALLGYGFIWVYDSFGTTGFAGTPRKFSLESNTQLEGICFVDETEVYLTDEKSVGRGGNIYRYSLPLP